MNRSQLLFNESPYVMWRVHQQDRDRLCGTPYALTCVAANGGVQQTGLCVSSRLSPPSTEIEACSNGTAAWRAVLGRSFDFSPPDSSLMAKQRREILSGEQGGRGKKNGKRHSLFCSGSRFSTVSGLGVPRRRAPAICGRRGCMTR